MLHDIKGDNAHPLIRATAKLMCLLSSGRTPLAVAFVLSAGGLSPFNKVANEVNEETIRAGGAPAIRPVDNGVMLTKATTLLVCNSPSAKAAKKKLSPVQLGLGTRAGSEIAAHTMQALWEEGCVISGEDAVNGFNALTRQSVLDAVALRWPEGSTFVETLYGHASPCFFTFRDNEDGQRIRVIASVEGTRMGCPLGNFGFDLAMAEFVYDKLYSEFKNQAIMRALTDDLIPAFKPPSDPDDLAAWEAVFDCIGRFWSRYDQLAGPIGIRRNPIKSALLLPTGAPLPLNKARTGGILLKPTREGLKVGGAPVGC